ncbi:hypothetical protein D9611_008409 [Ephemerocybe angulata]|uniref:Hexosyltransferase n=1 Tax=Ephemerocybe angulata TaxID=980116 RepID=A0A8H5BIW2_9AGAR|nr:hypothetical protein D9611_008409 [Tulosesus angulatus]
MSQLRFRLSSSPAPPQTPARDGSYPYHPTAVTTPRQSPSKKRPVNDENERPQGSLFTPTPSKKRKAGDSSTPAVPLFLPPPPPLKKKRTYNKDWQKLDAIFDRLQELNWSFSDLLGYAFTTKEARSTRHATVISKFLQGKDNCYPAQLIEAWDKHRDGAVERFDNMYSLSVPYHEIKPVRPALTSYAAQKCRDRLKKESNSTVKPDAGLHMSARKKSQNRLEWAAIGVSTVEEVESTLRESMPLAFGLLYEITGEKGVDPDPAAALKRRRPGNLVTTHALSSLLYKRNSEARLLPLSLGLLAFAYSTPVDFMAYCSRIGIMPAYTTISTALDLLAQHQANVIREHARDPQKVGFLVFDNVQNYYRVRDQRMGSANAMNIGLAGTYLYNDIVILPIPENMNSGKTHSFFSWASLNGWVPPLYSDSEVPLPQFSYSNYTATPPSLAPHDPFAAWENIQSGQVRSWVRPDFVVKVDDDSFVMLAELESRLRFER